MLSSSSTRSMVVKVPRPYSAAFFMKWVLGAEPIPTVNSRLLPRWARM